LTPEAEREHERIRVDDRGHVRIVTFNRPDARNAFDVAMYQACASALSSARDDADVRAVIITGTGTAFSAGQDLNEMRAFASGTAETDGASGFPVLLDIVQSFPKPLLAAVNGVAVGLGFTILAHCDLVVAADDARFKVPFTELGVPAEAGSTYLFPMRMGWQRAAKVLFTSEWLTADDVVSAGIALEKCPTNQVLARTLELAEDIASLSPDSVQAIKRLLVEAHVPHVIAARRREEAAFAELLPRLAGEAG
jgi:enoyl-CoA hydratase/carnithine racemase